MLFFFFCNKNKSKKKAKKAKRKRKRMQSNSQFHVDLVLLFRSHNSSELIIGKQSKKTKQKIKRNENESVWSQSNQSSWLEAKMDKKMPKLFTNHFVIFIFSFFTFLLSCQELRTRIGRSIKVRGKKKKRKFAKEKGKEKKSGYFYFDSGSGNLPNGPCKRRTSPTPNLISTSIPTSSLTPSLAPTPTLAPNPNPNPNPTWLLRSFEMEKKNPSLSLPQLQRRSCEKKKQQQQQLKKIGNNHAKA